MLPYVRFTLVFFTYHTLIQTSLNSVNCSIDRILIQFTHVSVLSGISFRLGSSGLHIDCISSGQYCLETRHLTEREVSSYTCYKFSVSILSVLLELYHQNVEELCVALLELEEHVVLQKVDSECFLI